MLRPGAYLHGIVDLVTGPAKSKDRIVAFQNQRLQWVVRNAYDRVAFYRRKFEAAGITPDDIRTMEDLSSLPLTTRDEIQFLDPAEVCAQGIDPKKLLVRRTSGGSGTPMTIRRRWLEERILLAYRLRSRLGWGGGVRMRRAAIRDVRRDAHWGADNSQPFHEKLGFVPRIVVDWKTPKDELVRRLEEYRPDVITGAPSVLSWIADEWTSADRDRVRPRYVTCGTETLTPDTRKHLEQAFGARVIDGYGSHEFVGIAQECLDGGAYHIYEESLIAEVLKDGRPVQPGEEGVLVGTALHSFAMPFLRYVVGDLVVRGPETCPCGSPYATLLKIQGRVLDRFVLPDGTGVHPYKFSAPFRDRAPWVRRVQFVQYERARFRLRVVPRYTPREVEVEAAARGVEESLSNTVKVEIEIVEALPPSESGKFYPYVSYERLQTWRKSGVSEGFLSGGLSLDDLPRET